MYNARNGGIFLYVPDLERRNTEMMKRLFALLLALAMLLTVSAVFAEETEAASDTLLVTVDGKEIRENDTDLQYYYASYINRVYNPEGEEDIRIAKMYAMNYTLQIAVVMKKATAATSEEALAGYRQAGLEEWNDIVESFMADQGINEESTEEEKTAARGDVIATLESEYGYTEDKYVQEYTENEMFDAFLTKEQEKLTASSPDLAVATDEEIQQAYDTLVNEEMSYFGNDIGMYEMYQQYYGYNFHYMPEGYRGITHILLKVDDELMNKWTDLNARLEESGTAEESTSAETAETAEAAETEEPVTQEMVDAARQAILDSKQDVINEIMGKLNNGASFEELIAEYGEDTGMQVEENLKNGYSVHKDSISFIPAFTQAAAGLEKIGDVSAPIVSDYGIHILYYLRDVPAGALAMAEEERASLEQEVLQTKMDKALGQLIEQWVTEADVVWTEAGESWKFDQEAVDAYIAANTETAAAE